MGRRLLTPAVIPAKAGIHFDPASAFNPQQRQNGFRLSPE
jgi:hypothetical protein